MIVGRFERMESLFQAMESSTCKPDLSTFNTIVNVYAQAGFTDKAEEIFASIASKGFTPDATSWTSLMGVYARRKLFRKCMSLFQKMTQAGCTPDAATAKVLLSSCRSPEQVQEVSDMIDKLKASVFT